MHADKVAASLFQTPGTNTEGKQLQLSMRIDKRAAFTYKRQCGNQE